MKTFYREFALLINIIYWLPMFMSMAVAIVVAWFVGSHFKIKKVYKTIISLLAACAVSLFWIIPVEKAERQRISKYDERKEKYQAAKAVFDEQCKKAGEKIYRTVDNVDGIMLLKVREENKENIFALLADPMWDEAAITNVESSNGSYIGSFLRKYRIRFGKRNGYSFVDVLKADGSISRYFDYKGHDDIDEERDGVIKNPSDPARYAVTYEYNVDPELRKHWVAGITIKIIDRQTDELLAEKTIFSFEPGLGSTATARTPWYNAVHCPELLQRTEDRNPTHAFAVQVLKPTQFFNSSFNGDQK
ncbi:MAG: hypothetical protein IJ187_11525 [Neisseriaceae bacterium]|nr:hypothetical protein [Neisseriaceae bacterium]MBQ9260459.1 hypothetical protein [Neisseriaceae bacterium]MBQ9725043.1 hypothetical protein [Neisseriaceae bacterium]